MIQSNELRLGNYILENGDPSNVYMIDRGGISFYRINDIPVNNETGCTLNGGEDRFKPIPLTPEWLERCGRKCESGNGWEYQIQVGALKWYFRWNTEWYSEVGGIYIDSRVQYVHQLQNLYFALTGKELLIKEPA